jgi:outer membrane protein assembly factor BamB
VHALALLATACAGSLAPAFDARFPEGASARTASVLGRLPAPQAPASSATLVATSYGAQPELLLYDLAQARVRWRVAMRADSRPQLLGNLVLVSAQGRLLAFDAASGTATFSASLPECAYLGSARVAERIFASCGGTALGAAGGAARSARVVALDAHSGRVLWQREAPGELGRPAASAGLVLVPWQKQSIGVLDAASGRELARVRSRDDVIDWVRADARGVFFGQRNLYRLGRGGYAGDQQHAAHFRLPTDSLPGRPVIVESAFAPMPGTRSARGRIALYAEPEAVGQDDLRLANDHYYLAFYRYVFAYDAAGTLRWARMLPRDVVAGQALPQGVVVVSDDGRVRMLSKDDGAPLRELAVGSELAAASIDAVGITQAPPAGTPAVAAGPLRRALTEIALDTDTRLVPARAYAISELAKLDEPEVTRDLLDVYGQSTTPPELARRLADALRARRSGLEYLVDALAKRYDFLEQTRPAPLAVIVPALVEAHETRAVPRLVERMLDHETPLAVLPTVVHAVVELGDDGVVAPLLAFVRLYRADSSFAEQPEALIEAARGVLAHGREQGPALLASLVQDGRAGSAVSSGIAALWPSAQVPSAGADGTAAPAVQPAPALPEKLTQDAVNATFTEHVDELRACIIEELARNPKLALLRVAFIAESDGSTHALSFAPNSSALVDCLYPKIAAYRFPRFRSGREVESYVISVRPNAEQPTRKPADEEDAHWWDFYAARARAPGPAAPAIPWWQSQQPLAAPAGPSAEANATQSAAPATAAPAPSVGAPATVAAQAKSDTAPTTAPKAPSPAEPAAPAPQAPAAAPEDAWWTPAAPAPAPR